MIKKRPRGRPKTFDRERTVRLAMETYWRDGLHAVSLNELCRRMAVSKPLLYREFGGEDGLVAAALRSYRAEVIVPLVSQVSMSQSFQETCEFLAALVAKAERGCLVVKLRDARGDLGPEGQNVLDAIEGELVEAYTNLCTASSLRGEMREGVAPSVAGSFLDVQVTNGFRLMGAGAAPAFVSEQLQLAFRALAP